MIGRRESFVGRLRVLRWHGRYPHGYDLYGPRSHRGTSTVTITVSDGHASGSVPVTVKAGGNGRDTLTGTTGADLLLSQNGDDTLGGAGASDVPCGANDDKLSGDTGSDTYDGGPGTDTTTDFNAAEGDSRTNMP